MNGHSVAHWPESDPHCAAPPIQHSQCPWINMAAPIPAGGSFTTAAAAATPTVCGFHDHLNPPSCPGY